MTHQPDLFDDLDGTIRPTDPNVHPADVKRLSKQCRTILEMLRERPRTNRELATVSIKHTSRISDIRAYGYVIVCKRLNNEGLTLYTLKEPTDGTC